MIVCNPKNVSALRELLARYGLQLQQVEDASTIPGSYWGAPEAGLIETTVNVRADTPLHSALHETAHAVCMDDARRARLHTDAGGEYAFRIRGEKAIRDSQIVGVDVGRGSLDPQFPFPAGIAAHGVLADAQGDEFLGEAAGGGNLDHHGRGGVQLGEGPVHPLSLAIFQGKRDKDVFGIECDLVGHQLSSPDVRKIAF